MCGTVPLTETTSNGYISIRTQRHTVGVSFFFHTQGHFKVKGHLWIHGRLWALQPGGCTPVWWWWGRQSAKLWSATRCNDVIITRFHHQMTPSTTLSHHALHCTYIVFKAQSNHWEMANVIWAKCYRNNRELVRICGKAPRAPVKHNKSFMRSSKIMTICPGDCSTYQTPGWRECWETPPRTHVPRDQTSNKALCEP